MFHFVLFQSCCHYPYLSFLKNTGLELNFMIVKCFTTFLNRPLQKWGIWRPRFLHLWFSMGTILSITLLPIAIFLLARSFITELMQKTSSDESSSIILEPVVRIKFSCSVCHCYICMWMYVISSMYDDVYFRFQATTCLSVTLDTMR